MPDLMTSSDEQVDQITALLTGKELPEQKPEVAAVPDEAPAAEPEVAEEGSTEAPEADALDYGLKVPIKGGEPVTLGELKDAYQDKQTALLEVQDRENSLLRKAQDVEQLLSFIDELPPAAIEAAKQRRAAMYAQELPKLTAAIPGINTAEGAREVVKIMAEAAKDYGIAEDELRMVMDSRFIKWMYDSARQSKAIREARQNVKPLRSDAPKAQHAAKSSETELLISKAKQSRSSADKDLAISALLLRSA